MPQVNGLGIPLHNGFGIFPGLAVRGIVIHHDQLDVGITLVQHTFNGSGEIDFVVVSGDDYTDQRKELAHDCDYAPSFIF